MSLPNSPVVTRKGNSSLPRGKNERRRYNNRNKDTNEQIGEITYSDDLRSRFGVAFLPFASQLESVEMSQTQRKRKGKNKKKQPVRLTKIPKYITRGNEKRKLFDTQCKINRGKINRKVEESKMKEKNDKEMLEWQGDTMTFDDGWPNVENKKTLRIFNINLNGVTSYNNFLEWEMTIAFLMDMQVDVFGLTEINLDLNNGMIKDRFIQSGKHFDNYLRMATSSSLQTIGDSTFKMGGTVTGTNGRWSGRIMDQGSDKLGRWSYQRLEAKNGKKVVFITVYIPNQPTKEGGGTTIYKQMELDLLKERGEIKNPRTELLQDLHIFIKKENDEGNTIFLMGDMNDNMGMEEGQVRQFLRSVDMTMAYTARHGKDSPLPATHDRGNSCIDMIGCSAHVQDTAIVRAGYAPFYFNFFTDHRGTFIDIDIESVFYCNRPDTNKPIYKRFTTIHVPKCLRYLKKLEELMEGSKIFQQVEEMEAKLLVMAKTKDEKNKSDLISRTKVLFKKVSEFMICAERHAGPKPYRDGFPDSPKLRDTAFKVIRIKKYLRLVSLGKLESEEEEKINIVEDLKKAQLELRNAQKSSTLLRQAHLERLAEKRSHQWQMSSAEALHIINESEKSKLLHGKHRRLLKQGNDGTLRSLLVPAPTIGLKNNEKDPRLYTSITDSNTMFNILLKRNFRHLLQSNESMFTKGPLLDLCGWYGKEEGMESILQGMLDTTKIEEDYPQFGKEGVEFMKALRYKEKDDEDQGTTFTWKFGTKEYLEVFNKTNESTACGPSGLHMSHWKAACEREKIARVHAFFMWAAFEFGFTYERWENSWHCMIKKLKQPLLPKLRIVQLFEGDFNAGLKYLIGRKLMQHMNKNDLHDPETFGSRTGKTAPEAIVNLQLLFDHNRIWNIPTAILFNDAIGCYDRIVPTICELAMRARGCPKGIAKCHTLTQKGMKHRIRIATGVSEGVIKFSEDNLTIKKNNKILTIQGKTGGIGQGGGAGPLSWIAVIDIMLEAYRKLCPGAVAKDPMMLYTICYWLISYVDDNTIVVGFKGDTTKDVIISTLKSNLRSWRRLLQLTGGDIDVVKSKWCVMIWKYCHTWGTPKIENAKEFRGEVGLISNIKGYEEIQNMERLEPSQAERVLGVRVPLDGNMKIEYKYRCNQIRDLSKKVFEAPLNQKDAWTIYESRYRAIIRYPLPVTQFSARQCNKIQQPFINAILPKMGINRHTPRVVIYGPISMGGLEMMDLRIEQVAIQWETTLGHLRRLDRAGRGLHITANDTQIEVGSSTPFFKLDPDSCNYVTPRTRWKYLWETTFGLGLEMSIYKFWTPQPINDNDRNIMDTAMQDTLLVDSKWPMLFHINRCRLFIRATFISDMTRDGVHVHKPFLDGSERVVNTTITIPEIHRPTKNQWNIWKAFIFRNFLSPGTRINPSLGRERPTRSIPQLPVSETDILLDLQVDGMSMAAALEKIPTNLKVFVGRVDIPLDDGIRIGESIVEGTCIGASDGSLIREYERTRGSHGYAIGDMRGGLNGIDGWGPSPNSDDMSSLTTEHYGLIGLLVILHILCKQYKLCREECFGVLIIYIDNRTVIERGMKRQELVNISDYVVPDQDLWSLTTELIDALPITIHLRWVRGHQDTNTFGETIHGPYQQDVMMNIKVDDLARRGMKEGANDIKKKLVLSTEVISLHKKNGVQIKNLRKYMVEKNNGQELKEYMMRRKGWTIDELKVIEWEGIDAMLRSVGPMKRAQLIKLIHNWQNTGRQKGRFRDARLKLDSEAPLIPTEEELHCHECPDGCNEEETDLHYLNCPAPHAVKRRQACIIKVLSRLKKLRTYEGIMSNIGYILGTISLNEDINFDWDELHRDGDMALSLALIGQEAIGWNCLCQGFIHVEWAKIQARHYRRMGEKSKLLNIGRWKKMFCTILTDYSLDCWKLRNESIHGKETDTSRLKKKGRLQKQIKGLYKQRKELPESKKRRIFDMPLDKRLQMGIHSSTLWIGLAEEVLRRHREQLARNTLHHWLQP